MNKPNGGAAAVDGSELLANLAMFFQKYVRVGDDEYMVVPVWVLHAHAWKAWTRTPYLDVNSPTPECGKTLLLELIELVAPNAIFVMGCSAAVLPRAIDQEHPVLLIDEIDKLMEGDKELWATVLQTINSGYKKSGTRLVSEFRDGRWTYKKLSTFCAKALSGISELPAATAGRCIPVNMLRMLPDDRVAEIDEYIIEPEASELFRQCDAWAKSHLKRLRDARPVAPRALGHRQREVSRPLLAIADEVGNGWGERVRDALVRLFAPRAGEPDNNIRIRLLHDMKDVFGDRKRISSKDAAAKLGEDADAPWSSWGKTRKPITQAQLAQQLWHFRIAPKVHRNDDGTQLRGYDRAWFEDLWKRYPKPPSPPPDSDPTPHPPLQTVPVLQPAETLDETAFSDRTNEADGTPSKSASDPHKQRVVTVGTVQRREYGGGEGSARGETKGEL